MVSMADSIIWHTLKSMCVFSDQIDSASEIGNYLVICNDGVSKILIYHPAAFNGGWKVLMATTVPFYAYAYCLDNTDYSNPYATIQYKISYYYIILKRLRSVVHVLLLLNDLNSIF